MNYHIRHANPADYEAVARIFSGPKAVWGTIQIPFPAQEVWRKRLAEPEPGLVVLMACHEADVIGMIGLHTQPSLPRRKHAAWLGMAVRDDWQGKGAGTAMVKAATDLADNWLNLERLELNVFSDNEAGMKLYRKFGFEIEGTLRRFAFRDGQYVDAYAMGRLRPTPSLPSA